jgi:DNA (cytosine-5)-methyltransferase 1
MERLRIGSFFSGIGAFEKALERLEIPHETVFYCEIDKYASKAYSLIHNVPESFNLWDITKVDETELPDFDLMTWGFPCQDISVAGKQAGIIEGETRSGLYHDGLRILRYKKPKYSIIENVKNLTSEKFRPIFHQILCDLEDAGYHSYYEVLNAKDYGIPQNRERIFIVSIRKDVDQGFVFPLPFDNGLRLKDLLEDEVDEKYYISQEKTDKLLESLKEKDIKHLKTPPYMVYTADFQNAQLQGPRLKDSSDYSFTIRTGFTHGIAVPILTPDRQEKRQNGRRFKDDGEPMFSLTTQDRHGILQIGNIDQDIRTRDNPQTGRIYDPAGISPCLSTMQGGNLEPKVLPNYRIRKLTPLECFRLMGFDDADFKICKDNGISDSQLYKMAGNSIVVQVLEGILGNLLKSGAEVPDCFYGEQMNLFG